MSAPELGISISDLNDEASESFPSVLVDGHLLHVYEQGGEWHVWLNTEATDFDGLCIGVGDTRAAAIAQAVAVLEAVVDALQKPVIA